MSNVLSREKREQVIALGRKRPAVAVTVSPRLFSELRRGSVSVQATSDIDSTSSIVVSNQVLHSADGN